MERESSTALAAASGFQTPRAVQTQGQVMMMGSLEPDHLKRKYFSSFLTGYEPHMEVSCFVKGKRNQRDSSSYTTAGAV